MRTKAISTIFLILITIIAHSQDLSLDYCLTLATQQNLEILSSKQNILAAEEVKKQAFSQYFPRIEGSFIGYKPMHPLLELGIENIHNASLREQLYNLYFSQGAALGFPNTIDLADGGLQIGITLLQPIFVGGQIINGNRLAHIGIEASKLQNKIKQRDLALQIEENYWLIKSLEEKEKTLIQAQKLINTLLYDIEGAIEAGFATKNDKLKIQIKQQELANGLLQIKNGKILATKALCNTLQINYSPQIQLTDSIPPHTPILIKKQTEELVLHRPESKLLTLKENSIALQQKIELGKTFPQLIGGISTGYGNLLTTPYNYNLLAFLTLKIPISQWWESAHKHKQHNHLAQQASLETQHYIDQMGLEIEQLKLQLSETENRLDLQKMIVTDARNNYETAQMEYKVGKTTLTQLLEAETLYRQAIDQEVAQKITYRITYKKLQYILQE